MALQPEPRQILEWYRQRRAERSPLLVKWQEIAQQVEGKITIPLNNLSKSELATVINLLGPGLDQFSMRAASYPPGISYPPLRDGIGTSMNRADDRRKAHQGWWDMNGMGIKRRERFRYLFAYGESPVTILPVSPHPLEKREMPHWRVHDPMSTFASPRIGKDDMEPLDSITISRQTLGWLKDRYPEQIDALYKGKQVGKKDARFDVLEYIDCDWIIHVAVGADRTENDRHGFSAPQIGVGYLDAVQLDAIPNRANIPLMIDPGRITLGVLMGLFDTTMGKYRRAAKLDALELLAIQRSIFPDIWAVSHAGDPQSVSIVEEADGMLNIVGRIDHGTIQPVNLQPGQMTNQAIDRLERAQRVESFQPAEFGGESPTNVRTARRGDMVMGSAIDMPLQEQQELMARSEEAEGRRAIAVMKGWYGPKATSFYLPQNGEPAKMTDYTPDDTFETDTMFVKYSMPGVDVNGLVVGMGQRVAEGEMSLETFREIDPAIDDPALENERVTAEGLRRALLSSLENQAASGALDSQTIARIVAMQVKEKIPIEEAVTKVHEEMQSEQSQGAPAGAPETQPGMGPGAQPPPAIPPVGVSMPSAQDLAGMLASLRSPGNQSPGERSMAGAGAPAGGP